MKKLILSSLIIITFGLYAVWNNTNNYSPNLLNSSISSSNNISYKLAINSINSSHIALNNISAILQNNSTLSTTTQKSSNYKNTSNYNKTRTSTKKRMMMNKIGIYNDGQYTGMMADAYYGNMQVKVVISNGRLINIKMLAYPHNNGNSNYINSYALPILKREAIQVQNANIDAVSGASASSPAFIETLASALKKAKA